MDKIEPGFYYGAGSTLFFVSYTPEGYLKIDHHAGATINQNNLGEPLDSRVVEEDILGSKQREIDFIKNGLEQLAKSGKPKKDMIQGLVEDIITVNKDRQD